MIPEFITNYKFGRITIQNQTYSNDIILLEKEILSNWRRNKSHSLTINDLTEVINYKPELLIIGTGYYGFLKVTARLSEKLPFKIISQKTQEAIKTYNQEIEKNTKISGAFHLSC